MQLRIDRLLLRRPKPRKPFPQHLQADLCSEQHDDVAPPLVPSPPADREEPATVEARAAKEPAKDEIALEEALTERVHVPSVDPVEDPVLPALEEAKTEVSDLNELLKERTPSPPEVAPPERPVMGSWRSIVRRPIVQLAFLGLAGVAAVVALLPSETGSDPPPSAVEPSRFPTIEIEGAPPVTEEQIERRMRASEEKVPIDHDERMREELKAIAALGREMAGVEAYEEPERKPAKRASKLGKETSRPSDEVAPAKKGGRWFSPGGLVKVEGAPATPKAKVLPLGIGDRLSAKLEVGIASGHSAPVLARLTKEVRSGGRVVAPEGAIAKGRFQADALRIYVTFSELILPDGDRLSFEGYAIDQKIPGLIATRRELPDDAVNGVVHETVDVAKDVARSLASGSIIGRVAQGVTEGAVPESAVSGDQPGVLLEVPAGKHFQIVVTGGEP